MHQKVAGADGLRGRYGSFARGEFGTGEDAAEGGEGGGATASAAQIPDICKAPSGEAQPDGLRSRGIPQAMCGSGRRRRKKRGASR